MADSLRPHGLYVAHKAPLSMRCTRQEYWNGLPFPPLGDLPDPGIEPAFLMSPALAGGFFITHATWEAQILEKLAEAFKTPKIFPETPHYLTKW